MFIDDDGNQYDSEEDYMRSIKGNDNYHFSIPFVYTKVRHGDGDYEDGDATMEVDFNWDDSQLGYTASYYCPEESDILASDDERSISDFWEWEIKFDAMDLLGGYVPMGLFAFL